MGKRTFLLPLAALVSVISPTALANFAEPQHAAIQTKGQEKNKEVNFSFILERPGQNQYFARHASHSSHSSHASHASHSSHFSSSPSSGYYPNTTTVAPSANNNQTPVLEVVPQDAVGIFNGIPIYEMKKK
jgi:hypothetical protein